LVQLSICHINRKTYQIADFMLLSRSMDLMMQSYGAVLSARILHLRCGGFAKTNSYCSWFINQTHDDRFHNQDFRMWQLWTCLASDVVVSTKNMS